MPSVCGRRAATGVVGDGSSDFIEDEEEEIVERRRNEQMGQVKMLEAETRRKVEWVGSSTAEYEARSQ